MTIILFIILICAVITFAVVIVKAAIKSYTPLTEEEVKKLEVRSGFRSRRDLE